MAGIVWGSRQGMTADEIVCTAMAAGMIAIRYNCKGAALPAVTACASGSNAIGEALRVIRHGYADAVIAGGAAYEELLSGGYLL